MLGYTMNSIANSSRKVILSLCLVQVRLHQEHWAQFQCSQYKTGLSRLSAAKTHKDD